jgi:hypothetical protein
MGDAGGARDAAHGHRRRVLDVGRVVVVACGGLVARRFDALQKCQKKFQKREREVFNALILQGKNRRPALTRRPDKPAPPPHTLPTAGC